MKWIWIFRIKSMIVVLECQPVTQALKPDKIVAGLLRDDLFLGIGCKFPVCIPASFADIVAYPRQGLRKMEIWYFPWGHL